MEYYQEEIVKVELDCNGYRSFFFYGRDGRENLGPELRMTASNYNAGTIIKLREKVPT